MIWIRSLIVGVAGAVLATVAVILTTVAWIFKDSVGQGSGGIGAVSAGVIEMVFSPALVGFVLGFWLNIRRERRKRSAGA